MIPGNWNNILKDNNCTRFIHIHKNLIPFIEDILGGIQ